MTETFERTDLTGARFDRVRLSGAVFRLSDLSGASLRATSLAGAEIEAEAEDLDGLRINGVDVAALVEAELTRREPARALRRAPDPAGLRDAWAALEHSWAATCARAAALPPGSVDVSVADEWSFAHTLRHLVFATDAWLGAVRGEARPFHPWGTPFSSLEAYAGPAADLGVDTAATPTYDEVLAVRADRVARVRDLLATATPERLAETVAAPVWDRGQPISVLRCVWVILNEECEHLRYAQRDLAVLAAAAG